MEIDLDTIPAGGIEQGAEAAPMHPTLSLLPVSANWPGKGVNELRTRFLQQVGIVSIREDKTPGRGRAFYELRYTDPDTGLEVKRRIKVGVAGSSPVSRSTPSQKMIQK